MKLTNIGSSIVHIVLDERNDLAECFIRFQEYYESPFDDIKNCIFTLGYVKSKGRRDLSGRNINTYCGGNNMDSDWSGYNFPDYVLNPFIRGLFDPLTNYEQDMIEALKYRTDKFYVIGTYGDDDPSESLEHEIRHAMYYVSDGYRKEVDAELAKYTKELKNVKKWLTHIGYCEEVLMDECQAYIGADYEWTTSPKNLSASKFNIKVDKKLSTKLTKIANKYKKELGIKLK